MLWKETGVMDERMKFVGCLLTGEKMAHLCKGFGTEKMADRKGGLFSFVCSAGRACLEVGPFRQTEQIKILRFSACQTEQVKILLRLTKYGILLLLDKAHKPL